MLELVDTVLGKVAHAQVAVPLHFAFGGLERAREQPNQRALASAVLASDREPRSGRDGQVHLAQHWFYGARKCERRLLKFQNGHTVRDTERRCLREANLERRVALREQRCRLEVANLILELKKLKSRPSSYELARTLDTVSQKAARAPRWQCTLSDSIRYATVFTLHPGLNGLVLDGTLREGTVIALDRYTVHEERSSCNILTILSLEVVSGYEEQIGFPRSWPTGQPAPAERSLTSSASTQSVYEDVSAYKCP